MKKVLAWAVVLALVLSSFTMAFADQTKTSADFKDASEITYTEAVDVMVALGVINGFPDGTFGPQKTVQRGQMAKMIAVIMNGGEDVGDQYKSACPFADSKDHWAAGYIAYCASEHIIDGRSADVFDPNADVTGTEVAKMALTSLGYDSKIQGYTGETWAANVLKDAKKAKLFAGLDKSFVPGDPCPREAAAQILFNMLKAPTVEYDTNISMSTADGTNIAVASKVQPVVAEDEVGEDGKPLPNETGYVELFEDVFGEDSDATLEKIDAAQDDFGRPGHAWKVEGDDVGTYTNSADYTFTAEAGPTAMDAINEYNKDLADEIEGLADFDVIVNGGEAADTDDDVIELGDTIEIYGEDGVIIVAQYEPYLITEVDTEVGTDDAEAGITAYVKVTQNSQREEPETWNDADIAGYDASTYVADAVIAVAWGVDKEGQDAIIDSYVLEEAASGEVTKLSYKAETVTIDGTAYEFTGNFEELDGNSIQVGETYTFYDYNGYVIASIKDSEESGEVYYGILLEVGESSGTFASDSAFVLKVFTSEGKEVAYALDEDFDTTDMQKEILDPAVMIAYELNDEGAIKSIDTADKAKDTWNGQGMKTNGVLYGKDVSEDVVAFAQNEDEDWVVYGFSDLEDADSVDIEYYFDEDGAAFLALKLENDLVETPEKETTLGLVTGVEVIENTDGYALEVTAFVDGKEVTYTTVAVETPYVEGQIDPLFELFYAYEEAGEPIELVKFTFDGELVSEIAVANCVGASEAGSEFDGADALFYGAGNEVIPDNVWTVLGKSGTALDLGLYENGELVGKNYQSCKDAIVYYINADSALEVSSFSKIKKNECDVVLLQTDEDASAWNVVIFMDTKSVYPKETQEP